MIRFEVEADSLIKELERRANALDGGSQAHVARYGAFQKDLTQQLAAVDTGFMRDHVETRIDDDGLGFESGWWEEDFIAAGEPFYPPHVEYGTINSPAQPAIEPAWSELRPHFIADGKELIRRTIVEGR